MSLALRAASRARAASARHTAGWLALPGDTHEFLAGQPAPYGHFFAGLERVLHDHGPITMPALIDELGRNVGDADDGLRGLLARLAGFHDVDDDEAPEVPIAAVLQLLRQEAVNEELKWLTESGELSDEATARLNALSNLRAEFKRGLAAPAPAR